MEQIRETLTRLAELSDTELDQLSTSIVTEFESISKQELTNELGATMVELADASDAIAAEKAARETAKAELAATAEEAAKRIKGAEPEDAPVETEAAAADVEPAKADETEAAVAETIEAAAETVEAAAETDKTAEAAAETVPEAEAAVVETVVEAPEATEQPAATEAAVEEAIPADTSTGDSELSVESAAAEATDTTGKDSEAPTVTEAALEAQDVQAPATHQPKENEAAAPLTASISIVAAGGTAVMDDMDAIAVAMSNKLHSIRNTAGGDGEPVAVASIHSEYPEERQLSSGSPKDIDAKVRAVASPEAVVAAGGFCAPVEVSYDIFGFGTDVRPVKAALAAFQADRGGLRFTTSPVLGDLDGAVSVWTLQNDIDAASPGEPDPVKPCLRVECGEEIVVYTDAIPLCLTFGNLQTRAFPELVARNNELALITHARFAETRLLTRLGALSTQVTAGRKLGAVRDFLVQVDQAAAGYRSRHRLDEDFSLRVIAPVWLKNLLRSDLVMQMPGDANEGVYDLADSQINRWFTARHINVSWTLDGEAGQIFGAQNAGALLAFPSTVVWYLFAEGTFIFLDGGTLDLGLVRDSTLNQTNDYKMFVETFEGLAKPGIESLRITSSLKNTGASAGTVDPAGL